MGSRLFHVDNINEMGGITRSGRCYTLEYLQKQKSKDKGKARVDDVIGCKIKEPVVVKNLEGKKPTSIDDIQEFLRLVKQSDYTK